jgi:hypothetical protein
MRQIFLTYVGVFANIPAGLRGISNWRRSKMAFCSKCGTSVAATAAFCGTCGAVTAIPEIKPSPEVVSSTTPVPELSEAWKKTFIDNTEKTGGYAIGGGIQKS